MTPDRLAKDPVVRVLDDLDRTRKWLLYMAVVIAVEAVAIVVLAFTVSDLSEFIRQPGGRDNRMEFQCQVQRALDVEEVDCDDR